MKENIDNIKRQSPLSHTPLAPTTYPLSLTPCKNRCKVSLSPNPYYSLFIIHYSLLIFLLLLTLSCSINTISVPRPISGLVQVDSLAIDHSFDKVDYFSFDGTFVCLQSMTNSVFIYRDGRLQNRIGGIGNESDNFRNLSDISYAHYGNLYTLDSSERSIKQFNRDGRFQWLFDFHSIPSPTKFAFSPYGTVFIYDSHAKEIHCIDNFDYKVAFSFGKFQFDRVETMFINGEHLNVFDSQNNETYIFMTNGKFENSYAGFTFFDGFKNLLNFADGYLTDTTNGKVLYQTSPHSKISVDNDQIVIYDNKMIRVFRLNYEYSVQ